MGRDRLLWLPVVCSIVLAMPVRGQGPGSCGFHLDIRADRKSTHSAIADMPNAPGQNVGMTSGSQGNPYDASATPGAAMQLLVSGNSLAYGPTALGPGSCLTVFWAFGSPLTPVALGPPFLATCLGGPHIIGVLPFQGTLFDSCGFTGGPPFGLFDPGSGRFSFGGTYPSFALPPVTLQAAG